MSLRNFIKKHGKRIAGTWGRVNHKKDKRAAGKGIRRLKTDQEKEALWQPKDQQL